MGKKKKEVKTMSFYEFLDLYLRMSEEQRKLVEEFLKWGSAEQDHILEVMEK